ncbi:trypsin-like peptidase domain-containing protein [Paenibacillus sp. FSL R7-0048]|uniref:trypsin-like serine peptidase n=1 Tax=Paenibacillus TaxID=44249 RepID=UPI00096DC62A|nr:trypsin-like peptidase domain-containing protein [Paenibacillus odorifer]OMD64116.1 hypothetical protein BSK48_25290 [Paenibacillus odorifer]
MLHSAKEISSSVCRLTCGPEDCLDKGTAFLISPSKVITATHNIKNHLNDGSIAIVLEFLNIGSERNVRRALPVTREVTDAVVVLELDSPVNHSHLRFSDFEVGAGDDYSTFGYPTVKWSSGQWVGNKISRVIGEEEFNSYDWNIDLSHQTPISDFSGLSGAPLMVDGRLVGVFITEAMEKGKAISLGAIGVSKFEKVLSDNHIDIHEYIDPYFYELEEDYYKDFVFVEKLEAAQIFEHQLCQTEFFHAEMLSNAVKSKSVKSEIKELARLQNDVRSYWHSKHLGYNDENNGAVLLSSVYEKIELMADSALLSKNLSASLYAKKGMLHQWSDNCKIGWVKNYEENLRLYRLRKEEQQNE